MLALFRSLYFIGFIAVYSTVAALLAIAALPGFYLIQSGYSRDSPIYSLFIIFLAFMLSGILFLLLGAIFLRLLTFLFPLKVGRSSVYSAQMVFWAAQYMIFNFLIHLFLPLFRTTPLLNLFYRLMGAKMGANVYINSPFIYEPHLVEIGENSRIGENAVIVPHTTEGKEFICGKIKIGKNVTIGQYAQILPGAVIGDQVIIAAGAIVPKGKVIENNAIYAGNPLKFIRERTDSKNWASPWDKSRNQKRESDQAAKG